MKDENDVMPGLGCLSQGYIMVKLPEFYFLSCNQVQPNHFFSNQSPFS